MEEKEEKNKKNPIDPDKVTEVPHLLPYAHHIGSAIIKPIDKGKEKGLAMKAMYQQTESQLHQIKEQVEVLIRQAQEIHDKIGISEKIYQAEINFKPVVGYRYHLYSRKNGKPVISMISPDEWGEKSPYTFLATVELLADRTWDIIERSEEFRQTF